ncbi:hypothetical protein Sste5346_008001 [Sporothrix stenoceras]|uniref:Pre-mRNA-splicing factor 38B n=1 Tax=Sporothrix stenoceras TaxID=5173 RepID=A0ABR3YR86_9PEZI
MDDLDMQAYKMLVDPEPPTSRGTRPASKMKPNTRFLSHIVREAKSHNAALLARETADAQRRLKKLDRKDGEDGGSSEEEKEDRRHRRQRRDRGDDSTRYSARGGDRHRRRRHHRDDDDDEHRSSHRHRSHRSHHRDSSREDREREREKKDRDRDRESKSRSRRHHRDRDDDRDDRDTDKDRSSFKRKHRERSSSPGSWRSRRRSASPRPSKHDRHDRHDRDGERERTRARSSYDKSDSDRDDSDSDYSSDPLDEFVGPKLASDRLGGSSNNDSGIRIRGRGAVSASSSSMDRHFAADYDPANDVEHPLPAPRPQVPHRLSSTIAADDASTEMQEDRKQLLRDNTERLKAAGFTDKEIAILSRGGRRRLDTSNSNSKSPWAKKGEAREWDRDKVAGNDGPPRPEWAR